MTTPMTFSKTEDGRYQVTNSNGRDARAEWFINEDGPARHRVAAGITDFFADAFDVDGKNRNWGQCETPQERVNALKGIERLFYRDGIFTWYEYSLGRLFGLPDNIVDKMDPLLPIMAENLNGLEGHDRDVYRTFMHDVIVQYCCLAESSDEYVESFDSDYLLPVLTCVLRTEEYTSVGSITDSLDDLKRIGIDFKVDSPEDFLSSDVVLNIKRVEKLRFNPYFALMTRPENLDIHEAAAQLNNLNKRASAFLPEWVYKKLWPYDFTWTSLDHDWDSIEFRLANQNTECSHALALALEDRNVKPDKVDELFELFFPSKGDSSEFDDLNKEVHKELVKADLDSIRKMVRKVALNHGDMDLLKAWEWMNAFALRLISEVNEDEDDFKAERSFYYDINVSRTMVMRALDQYNMGLPWSFIAEPVKDCTNRNSPFSMCVDFFIEDVDDNDDYDIEEIHRHYEVHLFE